MMEWFKTIFYEKRLGVCVCTHVHVLREKSEGVTVTVLKHLKMGVASNGWTGSKWKDISRGWFWLSIKENVLTIRTAKTKCTAQTVISFPSLEVFKQRLDAHLWETLQREFSLEVGECWDVISRSLGTPPVMIPHLISLTLHLPSGQSLKKPLISQSFSFPFSKSIA